MSDADFEVVFSKINKEREFLNAISQNIWKNPELMFKEEYAHNVLTDALTMHGFQVQKHYYLPTAFRGEFTSKLGSGPTIAVLLEYDALPEIGHACGHNLIAEAGLAAALGIKAAMEEDPNIEGKLVVLGTPAEEAGGGKIKLIEMGAFDGVDVAQMVHPVASYRATVYPPTLCITKCSIQFKGKEAHSATCPWEGRNALDAAVACYCNISLLRQQIKPKCKVNGIITKGGVAANIIPAETSMEYFIRTPTMGEIKNLVSKVQVCIESAAAATGCEAIIHYDDQEAYENVMTNKVLGSLFQTYAERLGMKFNDGSLQEISAGSTDMGNVSHVVPSIHPFIGIDTSCGNHTKDFADAAGSPGAQDPTLISGKAMALTALKIMRNPEILEEIKKQFQLDIAKEI